MSIKGLDALRAHVPDLNTPLGVLRILFLPIILFLLVTAILSTGTLPQPIWLLAGEIVFIGVGFFLMVLFFRYKNDFKTRFGPLAYSEAASRFGYPGVAVISAVVARMGYLPGPGFPHGAWDIALPAAGWALIVLGAFLALRVLQAFGVDNLVMLYVYYPEESHLVNHQIYTVLRHPAYAAVLCITFGLALLNGNWFAFASAFIFALALWGWVHWFEEKELIERFGPGYLEYRQRVPAFWPRRKELKGFFGFLILGK